MNQMVFQLQPDIIVNNRNGLPGRFFDARAAYPGRGDGTRLGSLHDPE